MAKQKEGMTSAEAVDVMTLAIDAAMKRIGEMQDKMGSTSIDLISIDEWCKWDAADEKALVTDPCGIDGIDMLDLDEPETQAA
jgi:hypothetical protein